MSRFIAMALAVGLIALVAGVVPATAQTTPNGGLGRA